MGLRGQLACNMHGGPPILVPKLDPIHRFPSLVTSRSLPAPVRRHILQGQPRVKLLVKERWLDCCSGLWPSNPEGGYSHLAGMCCGGPAVSFQTVNDAWEGRGKQAVWEECFLRRPCWGFIELSGQNSFDAAVSLCCHFLLRHHEAFAPVWW